MSDTNSYEASSATPSRGQSPRNSDDEGATNEHNRQNHSKAPVTKSKVTIVRQPERATSSWNNWGDEWQADGDEDKSADGSPRRSSAKQQASTRKSPPDDRTTTPKAQSRAERVSVDSMNEMSSPNAPTAHSEAVKTDDETDFESASQVHRPSVTEPDEPERSRYTIQASREKPSNNLLMSAFNIVQVVPPNVAPNRRGVRATDAREQQQQQQRTGNNAREEGASKRNDGRNRDERTANSTRGSDASQRTQVNREEFSDRRAQAAERNRRERNERGDKADRSDKGQGSRRNRRMSPGEYETDEASVRDDESFVSDVRSHSSRRRNSESRELSRNLNKFLQIMLLKEERERPPQTVSADAYAQPSAATTSRVSTTKAAEPAKARSKAEPRGEKDSFAFASKVKGADARKPQTNEMPAPFAGPGAPDEQNAYYYQWLQYYAAWYAQCGATNGPTGKDLKGSKAGGPPSYVDNRGRQSVSAMSGKVTDDESAWDTTASMVSGKRIEDDAPFDAQSDGRATPEKFTRRHACARFARGAAGPLLCVLKSDDADRSLAELVDIRKLQQKPVASGTARPASGAPSRLVGNFAFGAFAHCSKAVRSEVLYALQDLGRFFSSVSFRDHDSAALLCAFLECLVRKNGSLSCADIAEFLLQHDSASPHTLKGWRLAAAAANEFGKLDSSRMSTRLEEAGDNPPAPPPLDDSDLDRSRPADELDDLDTQSVLSVVPDVAGELPSLPGPSRAAEFRRVAAERERKERCVRKYRELLLGGKLRVALDYASAHALWAHALFIAFRCFPNDRQLQQSLLSRLVERECSADDPLRTFYELALGLPPSFAAPRTLLPQAPTHGPDALRFLKANWKLHVAMMVISLQESLAATDDSVDTQIVERTLQSIVAIAAQFAQANHRFVAQLLYFLAALLRATAAGVPLNDAVNRDCKLVLLGGATVSALTEFGRRTFAAPVQDPVVPESESAPPKARSPAPWTSFNDVRELNLAPANAALRFREACFKTVEIFEYALTLLDANLFLTALQPFKYIYMTQLVANGHSEMAVRYAESLANVLSVEDRDRRQPRGSRPTKSAPPSLFPADLAPAVGRVAAQLLAYQTRCGPASFMAKRRLDPVALRGFEQPTWFKKLLSVTLSPQATPQHPPSTTKRPSAANVPATSAPAPASITSASTFSFSRSPPQPAPNNLPLNNYSLPNPAASTMQSFGGIPQSVAPAPTQLQPQPQPQLQPQPQSQPQLQPHPQSQAPQQAQNQFAPPFQPPAGPSFGTQQPSNRVQRVSQSIDREDRTFDMPFQTQQPQKLAADTLETRRRTTSNAQNAENAQNNSAPQQVSANDQQGPYKQQSMTLAVSNAANYVRVPPPRVDPPPYRQPTATVPYPTQARPLPFASYTQQPPAPLPSYQPVTQPQPQGYPIPANLGRRSSGSEPSHTPTTSGPSPRLVSAMRGSTSDRDDSLSHSHNSVTFSRMLPSVHEVEVLTRRSEEALRANTYARPREQLSDGSPCTSEHSSRRQSIAASGVLSSDSRRSTNCTTDHDSASETDTIALNREFRSVFQQIRDSLNNSLDSSHAPPATQPQHMQPHVMARPLPQNLPEPHHNQPPPPPAGNRRPTDTGPLPPPPQQHPQSSAQGMRTSPGQAPQPNNSNRSRNTSDHGMIPVDSDPLFNVGTQPPPHSNSNFANPPSVFTPQSSMPFAPPPANSFGLPPPPPSRPFQQPDSNIDSDGRNRSPSSTWDDGGDMEPSPESNSPQDDLDEDSWQAFVRKSKPSGPSKPGPARSADSANSSAASNRNLGVSGGPAAAGSGWLSGIQSALKDTYNKIRPPQAYLPDDKHKPLVWDEKTKSWKDTENKSSNEVSAPPPPPMMPAAPRRPEAAASGASQPAATNGNSSSAPMMPPVGLGGPPGPNMGGFPHSGEPQPSENMFSAQRGFRGPARNRYATPAYLAQPQPK